MAQRFGRRRRRAARESVAQAERRAAYWQDRANEDSRRARKMSDQLELIAERLVMALGRDTAFLPLSMKREYEMGVNELRKWRLEPSFVVASYGNEPIDPTDAMSTRVDMIQLTDRIAVSAEQYRAAVVVKVAYKGEVYTSFSLDALEMFGGVTTEAVEWMLARAVQPLKAEINKVLGFK